MEGEESRPNPVVSLVASGPDLAQSPISNGDDHGKPLTNSFFKSAQWSADGTSIFTSSSANRVGTVVLPEDLLEPREEPLTLAAQGSIALPEPTAAIAPAPYFSLSQPQTHAILVGCTDHPIQLHQCLPSSTSTPSSPSSIRSTASSAGPLPVLATYPLIQLTTEAYLTPKSLLWPSPGTHFLVGCKNLLCTFDITRPGSCGPTLRIPTIPSTRHISKGSGVGMRGTVSALGIQPPEANGAALVAAGTWTRWVGLYDPARGGECVATWSVASAADSDEAGVVGGKGIVQTVWSPCGRYLVVNERMATGLLVYDVRVTGRLLGALAGRNAKTNQRLGCDVFPGAQGSLGFELWAGDQGGMVQVWDGVGSQEGVVEPSWHWEAHESGIGSVAMHMSGSVVASCSGSWKLPDEEDARPGISEASGHKDVVPTTLVGESSLKIWSIGGGS